MAHLPPWSVQGEPGWAGKDQKSQGRKQTLSKMKDVEETWTKLPEFCRGGSGCYPQSFSSHRISRYSLGPPIPLGDAAAA